MAILASTGIVFNIQRFSIHDGPGIRTTVFMKGCSLRCFWCHNPEGLRPGAEVQYFPDRCIGDGECARLCVAGAHEFVEGRHIYHRDLCSTCGECVSFCYAEALELTGRRATADEVLAEVLRDRPFYESSGGGVTLSGGDPLLQPDFALALLQGCKREGVHTAIETAASCRWDDLELLLPFIDLVMMDLKLMDPQAHRAATGVTNERILANARKLAEQGTPLVIRVPVIPTVNATPDDIAAIATFVYELAMVGRQYGHYVTGDPPHLELLPFHRLAESKYRSLGQDYRVRDLDAPDGETMDRLAEVARSCGVVVRHR
jgi:pyruvate formate lyase activating enzyme